MGRVGDLRSGLGGYPGRRDVVGLVILFWSAPLRRTARDNGSGSMFSSPSYRRIAIAEVVAVIGGAALLGATGQHAYVIAWFPSVVGLHFLALGRLFFAGFYWLGTAFIAAGIAGTAVGLAGGGLGGIEATHWIDRCGKPVCGRGIYSFQGASQQRRLTGWRSHAATTSNRGRRGGMATRRVGSPHSAAPWLALMRSGPIQTRHPRSAARRDANHELSGSGPTRDLSQLCPDNWLPLGPAGSRSILLSTI